MKKRVLIIVAIVVALAIPVSAFAATSDTTVAHQIRGFFGLDYSKLDDTQKAVVSDYSQKMADLQKEMIGKMVDNGALTKEQGDTYTAKIEEGLTNNDGLGMLGMPRSRMDKAGKEGRGNFGMFDIDTNTLTDVQKTSLITIYKKLNAIQKDLYAKMTIDGIITAEQNTTIAAKIDALTADLDKGNLPEDFDRILSDIGLFGGRDSFNANCTTLTDDQKTALKANIDAYSSQIVEIQKEILTKLVEFGTITQAQMDTITQRMGNMNSFMGNRGLSPKGRGGRSFGDKSNTATPDNNSKLN